MIGGTDGAVRGELSSLRLSRVVTEVNNVKGLERGLRSLIMRSALPLATIGTQEGGSRVVGRFPYEGGSRVVGGSSYEEGPRGR